MHKKYYWIGLVLLAIVLAVVVWAFLRPEAAAPELAPQSETAMGTGEGVDTNTQVPAQEPVEQKPVVKAPVQKKPSTSLSYSEALEKYKNSRIQLDQNCAAFPGTASYANGTEIMFDNRANVERKIVFNLKPYTIPAYGFVVVKASVSTLPGVTYLDCGTSQNVATITLQ